MRSSVDFPQPDGPTMQTNSPGAIAQIDVVERHHAALAAHDTPCAVRRCRSPRRAAQRPLIVSPRRDASRQRQPASVLSLFSSTNGPSLLHGVIHVALVDDALGRELAVAHLVLHEPGLHVEHAVDIDACRSGCAPATDICAAAPAGFRCRCAWRDRSSPAGSRRRDRPGNSRGCRADRRRSSCA